MVPEPQLVSGVLPPSGSTTVDHLTSKLDDFSKAKKLRMAELDEVGDTILRDGSHFDELGKLKPNVRYQTGEYNYLYQTDELGRIKYAHAEELQLKLHDGRLRHKSRTPDKIVGDHADHVFGDLFGGSPELDNLVSQAKNVDLIEYRRIERRWENALKSQLPKKIHDMDIRIRYDGSSVRPISFNVFYKIKGKIIHKHQANEYLDANNKIDINLQSQLLRHGVDDLEEIVELCKKHNHEHPTEMWLVYDAETNSLDAKYSYEARYEKDLDMLLDPVDEFGKWFEEVKAEVDAR